MKMLFWHLWLLRFYSEQPFWYRLFNPFLTAEELENQILKDLKTGARHLIWKHVTHKGVHRFWSDLSDGFTVVCSVRDLEDNQVLHEFNISRRGSVLFHDEFEVDRLIERGILLSHYSRTTKLLEIKRIVAAEVKRNSSSLQ